LTVKYLALHSWNVTPEQARQIQISLKSRLELADRLGEIQLIAGADIALDTEVGAGVGGLIVYRWPGLDEVERQFARRKLTFPYVPGLLAFREAPVLLDAFEKLRSEPDLIFYDGHGYSHPRRFGITCHLGILLDRPTIGCAKSRLVGHFEEPPPEAGTTSPLCDGEETIGAVLRTRDHVQPIFVSQGHRVGLATAVDWTLRVCDGYRIPKPTREADHFVEMVKANRWREDQSGPGTQAAFGF
jgi:deoxyribonuclease V